MSTGASIAIIAIITWGLVEIVKMSLAYADKKRKDALAEATSAAGAGRIEGLEERIRVLESIVTDQAYDLKQKISSL